MENPLQRLKRFIDFKLIPVSKFEKNVGFSNGSFASQLKKNKTIGVDKLENILNYYPELSSEWVLTGKGNMINFGYDRETSVISKRRKTFVKHSEDKGSINLKPFTARQLLIMDRNQEKLLNYIKEYSQLYENFEKFEDIRAFMSRFSAVYVDELFDRLYETEKYLVEDKFNYEDYKNSVIEKVKSLEKFNAPLHKLLTAIDDFFNEIKPFDDAKIVDYGANR